MTSFPSFKCIVPTIFIVLVSFALPASGEQNNGPDTVESELVTACAASLEVCHIACGPVIGSNDDCGRKCQDIWAKCEKSITAQKKRKGTTAVGKSPKSKLSK
jgi:hypothetical protein